MIGVTHHVNPYRDLTWTVENAMLDRTHGAGLPTFDTQHT
jgi:hypothetical protein